MVAEKLVTSHGANVACNFSTIKVLAVGRHVITMTFSNRVSKREREREKVARNLLFGSFSKNADLSIHARDLPVFRKMKIVLLNTAIWAWGFQKSVLFLMHRRSCTRIRRSDLYISCFQMFSTPSVCILGAPPLSC